MSSIDTNSVVLVALQELGASSNVISKLQNEISTGLKVSNPTENADIWAIAQNERSKLAGWQAVATSIANGQSMADVAATGSGQISNLTIQIKAKWTALNDSNYTSTDQDTIVNDLHSLVKQIDNVANTSSFNGVSPLLSPITTHVFTQTGTTTVPAPATIDATPPSFSSVAGTEVKGSKTFSLIGGTTAGAATLSLSLGVNPDLVEIYQNGQRVAATGVPAASGGAPVSSGTPVSGNATLTFDYDPANGQNLSVQIDNGLNLPGDWTISGFNLSVPNPNAGQPVTVPTGYDTPTTTPSSYDFISSPNGDKINVSVTGLDTNALKLSNIDWNDPKSDTAAIIDSAITTANGAATYYGSMQNIFALAQTQTTRFEDAETTGIGRMVDANLGKDSAVITAEQTKQQLSTQALSIASRSYQFLTSLFRG